MPNKLDSEVIHLGKHFGKKWLDPSNQPFDEKKPSTSSDLKFLLIILAFLSIVGEESIKVLFRKNFGLNGLSFYKLLINFLAFLGLGILLFHLSFSKETFATETGSSDTHFIFGILYLLLALIILFKGLKHRREAKVRNDLSDFTVDSHTLKFLLKDKWKEQHIQYIFEPIFAISVGSLVTIFDRVAGIPLIFCAISLWSSIIVRNLMFGESMEQTLSKLNSVGSESFNEVL